MCLHLDKSICLDKSTPNPWLVWIIRTFSTTSWVVWKSPTPRVDIIISTAAIPGRKRLGDGSWNPNYPGAVGSFRNGWHFRVIDPWCKFSVLWMWYPTIGRCYTICWSTGETYEQTMRIKPGNDCNIHVVIVHLLLVETMETWGEVWWNTSVTKHMFKFTSTSIQVFSYTRM